MFLKSLLLRGFKTFADPTEIEFGSESRITAIVGPNGCGKSNILDATRWALGEDNSRELRVASLPNIIFAGTAKRKPLSLAEVTLIFDNAAGKLPIPFTEVAIKRRTFREGESEFYINKNLCRLKDIKDLLLDTGLGEGTYSIITQGQVDAILSSKGEERRAFFEEAAGINKYKTRRQTAEKKLIAAEQNILRINDLKVEVSEHLLTLEEQARLAKEYLQLQAVVRELELGISKKLLGNLLEKKFKLSAELAAAQQAVQEKLNAESQAGDTLHALRQNLRQVELRLDEENAKLDTEKDQLRDLELNRRFLESETQRAERLEQELLQQQEELARRLAALAQPVELLGMETGFHFSDLIQQLVQQAAALLNQLSGILARFGAGQALALISPAEKEAANKLQQELLNAEQRRLAGELEKIQFGLAAHRSELATLPQLDNATTAKTTLLEAITQLKQERANLFQQIAAQEESLRQQEKRERDSSQATTALEVALARIEGELVGIHEKLASEYNLSPQELEAIPQTITNLNKSKSEAEDGKRRLRELEPVNLLAIEEYDKTKERLAFIDAQLLDLNAARENLQNLIVELDLKAEETFIQTMQQLSSIFSETFAKLFNGGEAKISLAQGVPVLAAEIEIQVRPNGRRWLPLALLSGGERSLSAIAILFSLLKIRPSPFCFLDEVDAALDEANISRFAAMLKDFSHNTQILVITHSKQTMAAADNIYGITMEEPGVSKILSVKLAEAAA